MALRFSVITGCILAGFSGSVFADSFIQVTTKETLTLYNLPKNNVLDITAQIPAGSIIQIPDGASPLSYDYRASNGSIEHSSNGFFQNTKLQSVPESASADFTPDKIAALNQTVGGLYVSSTVLSYGDVPVIDPLVPQEPGADFLKNYDVNGKPKYVFTTWFVKRFGSQLNRNISLNSLTPYERAKWQQIYTSLLQVADRTQATDASLIFIDPAVAWQNSIDFETTGKTVSAGAWTIAVKSTAVRNDFANVPCAEFMSETIREAYTRASYDFTEDFNTTKKNYLIWSNTASVTGLGMALYLGGWIPWDSAFYKPKTGAIMLNAEGLSPGHAYLVAGENGRFIVDNGSPRGRDLRVTSDRIIKMMYQNGVFFLPPGIIPEAW